MSKSYEKYRNNPNIAREKSYEKYRVIRRPDSYPVLIGKSLAKGISDIGDLPHTIGSLIESQINSEKEDIPREILGRDIRTPMKIEPTHYADYIPKIGSEVREELGIKDPIPGKDSTKKIVSTMAEYAAPAGLASKSLKGISQAAGLGALVGAGEVGGVNPIITTGAIIAAGKFPREEKKVSRLLNNYTKGDDLSKLLNFDPKTNKFKVVPTTAEVAQNPNISNIHNALHTSSGIGEKMALNDKQIREALEQIGANYNLSKAEIGDIAREVIESNLTHHTNVRRAKTAPLYKKLKEDTELVDINSFNKDIKELAATEVGNVKKKVERIKDILPSAQEERLSRLKLKAADNIEAAQIKKEIEYIKNTATPSQIDKTITHIGEKIFELLENPRANGTLIHLYGKAKASLEKELLKTQSGLAARSSYKLHSIPIDKITQDKLLKKFVDKDKYGEYKTATDLLMDNLLRSSEKNVKQYASQIKGTKAEKATKAYLKNKFLTGAAEEGLPSYAKVNQFVQNYRRKAGQLLAPNEQEMFDEVASYLRNRNKVHNANKGVGSPTAARAKIIEDIEKYLGQRNQTNIVGKVLGPLIPTPVLKEKVYKWTTKKNPAYDLLEESLVNPEVAKKLLKARNR